MAKLVQIVFRLAVLTVVCVLGFYIGRPLYWKVTATLQEIREKDYTNEAVKQGISDLVRGAQKSVGWGHQDEANIKIGQESESRKLEPESQESVTKDPKTSSTEDLDNVIAQPGKTKTVQPTVAVDASKVKRLARSALQT